MFQVGDAVRIIQRNYDARGYIGIVTKTDYDSAVGDMPYLVRLTHISHNDGWVVHREDCFKEEWLELVG